MRAAKKMRDTLSRIRSRSPGAECRTPGLPAKVESPMAGIPTDTRSSLPGSGSAAPRAANRSFSMQNAPRADIDAILAAAKEGNRGSLGELLTHYRKYLLTLAGAHLEKRLAPRLSPSD